ncbi:iduronate 2-sulfatase [Neorhodopirellula lusitana]|uniref:Iduronate 2-sulfatase n=1 Tax=Neorhodopirellula lusitana TaxID=445327 RepID=A0ABY1PWT1_9BACT|nr:sulfatase [Neorhodopirellula lusitana]SMP47526.1 iduronate 2-sulfatase [Neorhodopirellula lusitana]
MSRLLYTTLLLLTTCLTSAIAQTRSPNVLLICVDDLRPELGCYGKDYIQSPHIDSLASQGRLFERHYVQAPTCGASRFAMLTGRYGPSDNNAIFKRADAIAKSATAQSSGQSTAVPPSLPAWFRQHGYTTVSVGKVSHHPGGAGGKDWDDESQLEMPMSWDRHLLPAGPWQHPRGAMHGLAHGEIRNDASKMDVFQSAEGPDSIYPDGLIVDQALGQMDQLAADPSAPFLLAVGIIRPHLPFGSPAKYMQPYEDATLPAIPHPHRPQGHTTWHKSGEFNRYNRWGKNPNEDSEFATLVRKHYAACVSYADAMVGRVLDRLDQLGLRDDTIIVLWGDHGWHLGEHAVWGKHTLFEEALHSPLIISYDGIPRPGTASKSMVETIDLFPTLCGLADVPAPDFVHGVSVEPILKSPTAPGHPAVSYARATTIRDDQYRLVLHPGGDVELYDFAGDEAANVAAQHPDVVSQLTERLKARTRLRSH